MSAKRGPTDHAIIDSDVTLVLLDAGCALSMR